MKRVHSLSFKIPAMISSIIFFIIFTLAIISIFSSSRAIKKATIDGLSSTVSGYSSMIDMILHEQLLAINTYSQSSVIIDAAIDTNDLNIKNAAIDRLKAFGMVNPYAINIGIADINGNIILDDVDSKLEGVSIANVHPQLFNRIKQNNYQFSFDNTTSISSTTKNQALLLLGGLRDNNKNIVGLIYINLDLYKVSEDFISSLNSLNARIIVANNDRIVILSSDSNQVGLTLPSAFNAINTSQKGVLTSYKTENDSSKRTAAYNNINTIPWTVIFSKSDSEIYIEVKYTILRTVIIAPIFIILCSILIYIYIKTITKPLIRLVDMSSEIASGNLLLERSVINRKDELGTLESSFYNMMDKLLYIIQNVRRSAEEIRMGAKEFSQGAVDLSNRTESQAASLEETASSMEEMASTIKSSTDQSVEGNKMMIESKSAIQSAGEIILETTKNIEEVYDASTKIKDITKIIEDIAFQTNILALNASVEAARAGEQGKGFAVVASEVRNLAQTTQSSVKDITGLVDNAYDKINKATDSARTSQDIFSELQEKIENTARIMQDISSTAVEQQAGVDQINRAVADMDSVTQQNAALVEESSSSSQALLNQAVELIDVISFFRTED